MRWWRTKPHIRCAKLHCTEASKCNLRRPRRCTTNWPRFCRTRTWCVAALRATPKWSAISCRDAPGLRTTNSRVRWRILECAVSHQAVSSAETSPARVGRPWNADARGLFLLAMTAHASTIACADVVRYLRLGARVGWFRTDWVENHVGWAWESGSGVGMGLAGWSIGWMGWVRLGCGLGSGWAESQAGAFTRRGRSLSDGATC